MRVYGHDQAKEARRRRRALACASPLPNARIKREKREDDTKHDIINLVDSEDEREQHRIAGRFTVRGVCTDEGIRVDLIEFLSDADDDDDDGQLSDASTLDLSTLSNAGEAQAHSFSAVEARTENRVQVDLLYDYERMYVDLADSSSSDDYESTDESETGSSESDDMEYDSDTPRALAPRVQRFSANTDLDKQVLMKKINRDIEVLEEQKPWRFVYRCLSIPFEISQNTDAYGFVFERWDEFWSRFGRAVWERNYWKFIPPNSSEYMQRKNRQSRAAKAFAFIAADLHQRFGVKLVDTLTFAPHPGWWYRTKPPVNLLRLYLEDCRLYKLHLSRFKERWPYGVRYVREKGKPMWWQADDVEERRV